jgi:hypothetical protein
MSRITINEARPNELDPNREHGLVVGPKARSSIEMELVEQSRLAIDVGLPSIVFLDDDGQVEDTGEWSQYFDGRRPSYEEIKQLRLDMQGPTDEQHQQRLQIVRELGEYADEETYLALCAERGVTP